MGDRPVIFVFLAGLVAVVAAPVWLAAVRGTAAEMPALAKPEAGTECVEPADYMRTSHMLVLDGWRLAVRKGVRTYVTSGGRSVRISLTGTCLECHRSKAEFCDRCHGYVGTSPKCGNCHLGGPGDRR